MISKDEERKKTREPKLRVESERRATDKDMNIFRIYEDDKIRWMITIAIKKLRKGKTIELIGMGEGSLKAAMMADILNERIGLLHKENSLIFVNSNDKCRVGIQNGDRLGLSIKLSRNSTFNT